MRNSQTKLHRFIELCIRHRLTVLTLIAAITVMMGYLTAHLQLQTVFDDFLPRTHPYIKVHEKVKGIFGGSNVVSIMVEVDKGDIFNTKTLSKVQNITRELEKVPGVNTFQIISLASKKMREIQGSTDGIKVRPLMWPDLPKSEAEMSILKNMVLNNAYVLGAYVSPDLKATLITVDFYDHLLDYQSVFDQIGAIAHKAAGDGLAVRVVGEPILYGWVRHYLSETIQISLIALLSMILILFIVTRTWRGTLLPLLAGMVSGLWALGGARLIGYNMDPLVIVVGFLITARAISHSVQLVTRFDDEMADGASSPVAAAKAAMATLFKPGMLGVVADAGCMIVVFLTPIPLLQKVAVIGAIWVSTISISACILTPMLLSWLKRPTKYAHKLNISPLLEKCLNFCVFIVLSRARYAVIFFAVIIFAVSGMYAFNLKVGDANPGSPILWPESVYNQDAAAINTKFQGADRMLVVVDGGKPNALKDPVVLDNIGRFQRMMEAQPEVGGTLSIGDVIPTVKRILSEDNPRFSEFGNSIEENGELLYMFVAGSDPGDIERLVDPEYRFSSVSLNFRDHKGETIRTAISRVKEFAQANPLPKGGKYLLAGGLIGVLAAVNEVILSGQIEAIALAFLVLVICCAVVYRSTMAGLFFMVPVLLSNTITFSYMAWKGIGMNINTLPVVALGIGLGVDYAFYIVDGIREELQEHDDLALAIRNSLFSAGKGVVITALTLTSAVVLWFFSSLRFQAEMGILMALWLFVSAICALFVMPAMVYVFRPAFVVGKRAPAFGADSKSSVAASEVA